MISGSLSLGSLTLTDNTGNANLGITFGTTASSANLYRSAANTLSTNDSFIIAGSLTVNNNVTVSGSLSAGTSILVSSAADGITSATGIVFGLSRDTSLYRSKFDQLKTDDSLFVGASLAVGNRILVSSAQDSVTATDGIIFGLSEDTNLYRSATNALTTDDSLSVAGTLTVTDSIVTPGSLLLSSDAGTFATGIIFGTNGTVNLYRSASDTLRTDDSFSVGGTLTVTDSIVTPGSLLLSSDAGTFASGIIFGTANTANLYRLQPDTLRTDDNLVVGTSLAVGNRILVSSAQDGTTATQGIIFGLSEDTNLYRSQPNQLKTDDSLVVGASLAVDNRILN